MNLSDLGAVYACLGRNPPPGRTAPDALVLDPKARQLAGATAAQPVTIPQVLHMIDAKRRDMQQHKGSGPSAVRAAPTSYAQPAANGAAAADERSHAALLEATRQYAGTLGDCVGSAEDYRRMLATRIIRDNHHASSSAGYTASAAMMGSSSSQQQQLPYGSGSGNSSGGGGAPDETVLGLMSSMGMLDPSQSQSQHQQQQLLSQSSFDYNNNKDPLSSASSPYGGDAFSSASVSERTYLRPMEAYLLSTLLPGSLAEALAYVPSLAEYSPGYIESIVSKLRSGSL